MVLFIYPQVNNTVLVSNYYLNQDEIEEEHCINKSEVELGCQGKCHLKEQIEETNKTEDNSSKPDITESEITYFFQAIEINVFPFVPITKTVRTRDFPVLHGVFKQLDKPPKLG
jgi:hypothetical protein